jgi:hypothetical protein
MFGNYGRMNVTTVAGSTRSTIVNSCTGRGVIFQNGTGTVAADTALGVVFQDGQINFNSTLGGTGANTVSGTIGEQSIVNVADGAGPQVMSQTGVHGFSTLNIEPGGSVSRCRFDGNSTLNTGAFSHLNSIIDGNFTVTATAANVNSLTSKAYSDWV